MLENSIFKTAPFFVIILLGLESKHIRKKERHRSEEFFAPNGSYVVACVCVFCRRQALCHILLSFATKILEKQSCKLHTCSAYLSTTQRNGRPIK